jgi:hypothetical protein
LVRRFGASGSRTNSIALTAEAKRALELDPLSIVNNTDAGTVYLDYWRFRKLWRKSGKLSKWIPTNYTRAWNLGQALEVLAICPVPSAAYEKATTLDDDPLPLGLLAAAKAKAGTARGSRLLSRLQEVAKNRYVPIMRLVDLSRAGPN